MAHVCTVTLYTNVIQMFWMVILIRILRWETDTHQSKKVNCEADQDEDHDVHVDDDDDDDADDGAHLI